MRVRCCATKLRSGEVAQWLKVPFDCGGQNRFGIPFWGFSVNSPPILEPILVGIGMFTGVTIWILAHGHLAWVWNQGIRKPGQNSPLQKPLVLVPGCHLHCTNSTRPCPRVSCLGHPAAKCQLAQGASQACSKCPPALVHPAAAKA